MENTMDKYTAFIFKYKKPLIGLLVILMVFSIVGIFRIKLNTDFSLFSTNDSVYEQRIKQEEETFGNLNQIVIIVEHQAFDLATLTDLNTIQNELSDVTNVISVQGDAPDMLMIGGTPKSILSIDPSVIEAYYAQFGDFSPLVKQGSTYYSVFNVFINDSFGKDNLHTIENALNAYGYQNYISGDTYNQTKITDYILRILLILPPLTVILILSVFRWQIGAIKPTIFSVLPAAVGSVWTLGLIGWLGNQVSILTAIVPIFIIVIGSADGLHFMSHFQDSKIEGYDNKNALTKTLKIVGIPMIVTTLTSMAGFLSLLSMNTSATTDLSIYASVGILFAGIATWYVLPLILTNNINVLPKNRKPKKVDLSKYLRILWGYKAFVLVLLIIGLSVIMIPKINHEFNMLMIYKNSTVVAKNAEKVQEVNGGSIPIYVSVSLDGSPITLSAMNEVNALANDLSSLNEVSKVVNPYALLTIIYDMNASGDIPSDMVLNMIYTNVSSDVNSPINNLISVNGDAVRLLVFPKDLKNETLGVIETAANQSNPNTSVTGVQYLMRDLNVNISGMQFRSILLAIGVVLIMMIITLRNLKVAVASILPIIVTVVALYGFLGVTGISLNVTTVIIFSITIGVGIDYAVHFSSVYRYFIKEGNTKHEAVEKAYQNASRPIIANALGISIGLSILMFSPLTIHFDVSILMWVSMIVSVMVTLTLLPTLFRHEKKVK